MEQDGQGQQRTENVGGLWQRTISCGEWTQPRIELPTAVPKITIISINLFSAYLSDFEWHKSVSVVTVVRSLQTCLPVRICPYSYGNWLAVRKYAHISQNTDTEFPESMEIAT